jgi:hypothetical protein
MWLGGPEITLFRPVWHKRHETVIGPESSPDQTLALQDRSEDGAVSQF